MKEHDATEIAFKNGYAKAKEEDEARIRELEKNYSLLFDRLCLLLEENIQLKDELENRPPRLIITKKR